MKSHQYDFRVPDLFRAVLPTLLVLSLLLAMLLFLNRFHLLPAPPISLDPDTTVLKHQAAACRTAAPAEIVLVGDSTCLVGVDAVSLSAKVPTHPAVLNLALFIWLDLQDYGQAVSDFATARPGSVRTVVLLVTPIKLTSQSRDEIARETWHGILRGQEAAAGELKSPWQCGGFGVQLFQRHLWSHVLVKPLRGSGMPFFGFSSEIDAYLSEHRGSLVDFGSFVPPRTARASESAAQMESTEPGLTPAVEAESRAFRASVPPGARLLVGFSPGPASQVSAVERRRRNELLEQWNQWLQADVLLTNLPPALPDVFFSRTAHLNEVGQKLFTEALARELEK